jgi:hypothetical protein
MQTISKRTRSPLRTSAATFGLLLALATTLVLSWPALTGPFLFDDFPNLENLAKLHGRLDWASLANYASLYKGEPGRPLSMLSFVVNDFGWPSDPWSFKYTNLLLHLLTGVLIFGLSRSLARLRTTAARADLAALLATSAWLLHPMQLSTSMLVVQRMTQLSALFAFAGLWAYVALGRRAERPTTALAAIMLLGGATLLALLSKETGALTPLLAVVINATFMRERLGQLPTPSQRVLRWSVALSVMVLFAAVAWRWSAVTNYHKRPFTMDERLLSQARALCDYLFNIVLPHLRGGGIYQDDFAISHGMLQPWTTLPSVLLTVGLVVAALCTYRRWPVFGFAVFWYFAGHLLESTVFPLELYFEHRNYLPMFGILFALALWAVDAAPRWRKQTLALAGLWIFFAAFLTHVQAPIWGNQDALVTVWALEHPQSPRAVQEKAAYYYRHGQEPRAAETLLDGYARGVQGSDFPAQVLLLACNTHDADMAKRAEAFLPMSMDDGEYNNALPITLRKLRFKVQRGACPQQLTEEGWLALTARLLDNPKYARGSPAAYLHTERAYLFQHHRDLNRTMLEFEAAWAAKKTSGLAQLMAATLASAGLYEDAETWGRRALRKHTGGIRGLFSQDDAESRRLLEAIQAARLRAGEEGNDRDHGSGK